MMEEDCEVDVESADDIPDIGGEATASTYDEGFHDSEDGGGAVKNDKREHHNLLERRRRDHIKDSFYGLRDCIPQLKGEKVSRAHILNKATEYIRSMQKCGSTREGEIVGLKLRNEILEQQIKALEKHKAAGTGANAEDILDAVQEEVTAKHKDDQQKQTKKISNLVSEKTESIVQSLTAAKNMAVAVAKKPAIQASSLPTNTSDSLSPGSPAFTLLASNLKSTQSLLTALQKSLPPNANLPANIKSLAQRVLSNPQARSQLQATATNALRGIVTVTTVTNSTSPSTPPKTDTPTKPAKALLTTDVLISPLNPASTESPVSLMSALSPMNDINSTGSLSPQQILNTAHLLLQQQGSALDTNSQQQHDDKQDTALSSEVLSQVTSYLNLPSSITTDETSLGEMVLPEDEIPNSFLTAALSTLPLQTIQAATVQLTAKDLTESIEEEIDCEEIIEHLSKKPRLATP